MVSRRIRKMTLERMAFVLLPSLIWGVIASPAFSEDQPQAALAGKNILVLHAFEPNVPVNVKTDQGLMTTLENGGLKVKQQFFEYLNLVPDPGPA